MSLERLPEPDIEAGTIAWLRTRLESTWPTITITDSLPLDPVTQTPLVVVSLIPGTDAEVNRFLTQAAVETNVWGDTRQQARLVNDAIRRALTIPGGYALDVAGRITLATRNSSPVRVSSGDPAEIRKRYSTQYDLLVRLVEPSPAP